MKPAYHDARCSKMASFQRSGHYAAIHEPRRRFRIRLRWHRIGMFCRFCAILAYAADTPAPSASVQRDVKASRSAKTATRNGAEIIPRAAMREGEQAHCLSSRASSFFAVAPRQHTICGLTPRHRHCPSSSPTPRYGRTLDIFLLPSS